MSSLFHSDIAIAAGGSGTWLVNRDAANRVTGVTLT